MKNLTKYIIFFVTLCIPFTTLGFHNSSSISWLTAGLEKFESSIPIPHYQDTFDIIIEENLSSLSFLTWKDENEFLPRSFKLTLKTHTNDGKVLSKECDIDPPSLDESGWIIPKSVSFLKSDRVLLQWQGGFKIHDTEESQTKFQVIFTNNCQSSKYSTIKTPKDSVSGPGIIIVKLKNSYDVIFHQSTIAPVIYFKWSFDYNGTPLKNTPEALVKFFPEVTKFSHITSIFPLKHNRGEGYIFIGKGIDNHNVYSTISGWLTAEKIYYSDYIFSNSSGFATICWKLKLKPGTNQINCKCVNETFNNLPNDHVLTVRNQVFHHFEEFSIHNQVNGRVLLLSEIFNITNHKVVLVIDEAQSDGKCRRMLLMELPGNLDRIELSIKERNEYCLFYVTHIFSHPRVNQFDIKCIQIPLSDNISQDHVGCGAI